MSALGSSTAWLSWASPSPGYNGGEAPFDRERFVNARAEDYWTLQELFENGDVDIDVLDDVLAAQLGSIKWTLDSHGRIKIESKDDMRKRACRPLTVPIRSRWHSHDGPTAEWGSTSKTTPVTASPVTCWIRPGEAC